MMLVFGASRIGSVRYNPGKSLWPVYGNRKESSSGQIRMTAPDLDSLRGSDRLFVLNVM